MINLGVVGNILEGSDLLDMLIKTKMNDRQNLELKDWRIKENERNINWEWLKH